MNAEKLKVELESLHDGVLLSAEMKWSEAKVVLAVRTGAGDKRVVVHEATRLECPRDLPWGPSICINEIRINPVPSSVALRIEIEMQSGDVLVILGKAVHLEE
jgi:hypothetical protein